MRFKVEIGDPIAGHPMMKVFLQNRHGDGMVSSFPFKEKAEDNAKLLQSALNFLLASYVGEYGEINMNSLVLDEVRELSEVIDDVEKMVKSMKERWEKKGDQ